MLPLMLLLLFQLPVERAVLEAEDSRSTDISAIERGLKDSNPRIQRLAIRALGRLERPGNADTVVPFLSSSDSSLRKEAINALGQMRAQIDLTFRLAEERDPEVRGLLYATMGRMPLVSEQSLLQGLREKALETRVGAVKGLEAYFRSNARTVKPTPAAIAALRRSIAENDSAILRELALLTLNAAGDADPATLAAALKDPNPQVRRLAVIGSRQWRKDPSYLVRYEALRIAGTCREAEASLHDPNTHVALLALDLMGKGCPAAALEEIIDRSQDWRRQSHALISLARVKPDSARARIDKLSRHQIWQARAYAAGAARIIEDQETLSRLLGDQNPNVVAAALVTPANGVQALSSSHYGLIMRATECLKGWSGGRTAVPALFAALSRITTQKRDTSRDPRRAILDRLREFGDAAIVDRLEPFLFDFDPVIAELAARIVSEKSGKPVAPRTARLTTRPVPPQEYIEGLRGARAGVKMREAGPFTLELLTDEAPVTVASFAGLSEKGYYNRLTFHRIVPNFVIQGGSPGADEFDGSDYYLRDEPGLLSHLRGTVGISTRGRDTGDNQVFINLVDNFRLDHNYTVFARVIEGMENVDRIQEGDIIESIQIIRRARPQQNNDATTPASFPRCY